LKGRDVASVAFCVTITETVSLLLQSSAITVLEGKCNVKIQSLLLRVMTTDHLTKDRILA